MGVGDEVEVSEDELRRLIRTGKVTLSCNEDDCDWVVPAELLGRDKANSYIAHLQEAHDKTSDEAFNALVHMTAEMTCPRCNGLMNLAPKGSGGEGPGRSLSRTSAPGLPMYICEDCGKHEAYQSMAGQKVTSQQDWPIDRPSITPTFDNFTENWDNYRSSNRAARTPAPTPREVPDLRMHLLEKWIPGGIFEKKLWAEGRSKDEVEWSRNWEREVLKTASLWWIKSDMVDLVVAASKDIPEDVHGHEVPYPDGQRSGFAVFAKPWIGMDAVDPDHQIKVSAIAWGYTNIEGTECLSMSAYEYFDVGGGLGADDLQRAILTGAIFDAQADYIGNQGEDKRQAILRGGSWVHMGRTDWPLQDTINGFDYFLESQQREGLTLEDVRERLGELRVASMIEDRRFMAAFAVLVNNKISETEMIYSPRVVRRRAEREHGIDPKKEPSHVRLIKLREVREKHESEHDPDAPKAKRHYSHRFLVQHHKLAWRACGPNHSQRRLVYIPPYIKGDPSLPLVIKDTVRVWSR